MGHSRRKGSRPSACEIVDFDEALLDACKAEARADLLTEAQLLAGAFAPDGAPAALEEMAEQVSSTKVDRAHARRLAAALKRLARSG